MMNAMLRTFCWVVGLLIVSGCAQHPVNVVSGDTSWEGKELASFPYHPLVYHLDLSILAYQLYSQSLVWPFDPYYEAMGGSREQFMAKVRAWANKRSRAAQADGKLTGLDQYRGPGVLGGFANNPWHDPILYSYERIYPWSHSISNPEGRWIAYMTPKLITQQIGDVYVSYRKHGMAAHEVAMVKLKPAQHIGRSDARDVLLAFEGGTGDKGEAGQPASQSLMGFVLLRMKAGNHYDVHIVFRGSRSGLASRAALQALSDQAAIGNPDWITDLGYDRLAAGQALALITTTGRVKRGFARSMRSILPQLFQSLKKVAEIKQGMQPDNIYVTGHSLGGALAVNFVSVVLLGDQYGSGCRGKAMPASLKAWPWKQIKLITYGAPRVGDELWAKTLTESGLDAEFFSTAFTPYDPDALLVTAPKIVTRLLDPHRPAGYRVLISTDPITTERVGGGGKHVGKTIYVNQPKVSDFIRPPDPEGHEPVNIRQYMVDSLADSRTPTTAWRYIAMDEMVADRDSSNKVSRVAEMKKLTKAVKRYYSSNGIWFDNTAFDRNVKRYFEIYRGD